MCELTGWAREKRKFLLDRPAFMWYTSLGSIAIFARAGTQGMRAPQKHNTIVSELHSRIVGGELGLGERLPSR